MLAEKTESNHENLFQKIAEAPPIFYKYINFLSGLFAIKRSRCRLFFITDLNFILFYRPDNI